MKSIEEFANDPRSCERNLCNCVGSLKEKLGLQRDLNPWPRDPVRYSIQLSYEATDVGSWSQHHEWLHSSELVKASHQHREVTGSNRVEVLNFFSGVLRNCINCVHNCEDTFIAKTSRSCNGPAVRIKGNKPRGKIQSTPDNSNPR